MSWLWVPRCVRICPAPQAKPGPLSLAIVQVSVCRATTPESYPDEYCEPSTTYGVHANDSKPGDRMTFNGGEVCVGHNVIDIKYVMGDTSTGGSKLHMVNSTECASFCITGVNGFKRVNVMNKVTSSSSGRVNVEREYHKYTTYPVSSSVDNSNNMYSYGGYGYSPYI